MKLIVERQTADWASGDIRAAAASFARDVHGELGEGEQFRMTVRLAELWDASFGVSFCECRHFLRKLAHENWTQVLACDRVFGQDDYEQVARQHFGQEGTWLYFTDDDDWYAPDQMTAVEEQRVRDADVVIWPRTRFDGELSVTSVGPDPVWCYTNNYAVRASSLDRDRPLASVMQHFEADRLVKSGAWSHVSLGPERTLSVTNKSPCSRNYLERALGSKSPAEAIKRSVMHYLDFSGHTPASLEWSSPWIRRSRAYFADVLRSAR